MKIDIELQRTSPDYVVFSPGSMDRTTAATGNEHILVEKLANGHLFAVWTQSSIEGAEDQHIVFSRSLDDGATWTPPVTIAGVDEEVGSAMASWGFPLVSASGRIYVIFSRHMGVNDVFTHTTGLFACRYTDDEGMSWSREVFLSIPRSDWDHVDPAIPPNCIVWQKPIRLSDGRYFTGLTRWVSPVVCKPTLGDWWAHPAVVEFMRFENIDDDPDPKDIAISFFAQNEHALRVGLRGFPEIPLLQEPSLVVLPDDRIFCVMRSTQGSPFYSISIDHGETWSEPLPLRRYDDGPVMAHPISPCPIYGVGDKGFIFLYHNHDGHFLNWTPADTSEHRRPICLARGEYRPEAKQPIWFSEPWYFMDNGGVSILRKDLAMYASMTNYAGGQVLWYPDRKFFLLGKKISYDSLGDLAVPSAK